MKKLDKLKKMQKANLLSEQRYLKNKITEGMYDKRGNFTGGPDPLERDDMDMDMNQDDEIEDVTEIATFQGFQAPIDTNSMDYVGVEGTTTYGGKFRLTLGDLIKSSDAPMPYKIDLINLMNNYMDAEGFGVELTDEIKMGILKLNVLPSQSGFVEYPDNKNNITEGMFDKRGNFTGGSDQLERDEIEDVTEIATLQGFQAPIDIDSMDDVEVEGTTTNGGDFRIKLGDLIKSSKAPMSYKIDLINLLNMNMDEMGEGVNLTDEIKMGILKLNVSPSEIASVKYPDKNPNFYKDDYLMKDKGARAGYDDDNGVVYYN